MYKPPLKQPQKLIPFESKYRDKRFGHVTQGIINPLHIYKDPRQPSPKFDLTIEPSKVILKPPPLEKTLKTKAYIPEDLKTPFIYIKQLVSKEKKNKEKPEFWNKSGNVTSLRVEKSVRKQDITDFMALSIPEINEDIANFLKNFLKNMHRLIGMKLYFDISHTTLSFPELFQGFCKIKRLKKEAKHEMLVTERQFLEFFKLLGWEKANFPYEDVGSFFQLAKIDDKNVYFQQESHENPLRKSLDLRKNLKDSDLAESKKFDEEAVKKTAVSKKKESVLSMKALIYNYEKFLQEKARIKSLTSLQSSFGRAEILRNLLDDFLKNYKSSKILMKMTLYTRTGFLLLRNSNDIPYVSKYDKLRGFYEDLAFEKATVMNFLKGKHFPDDLHPEVLLKSLEDLQKKQEEELKMMGDFVQEFKKEKQHFKEQDFTLLELVDFIYEKRYSRKDFDLLTKLIKKVKRMYNYSENRLPDDEIKPKHHINLSYLGQSLAARCHKVYLTSEILSNFIENLNTLILRNIEHYKPKNPEIHTALLHNLALDFTIKYLGNLIQKIDRIAENLNNVHSQIEETTELLGFLEEKTYNPETNFMESLRASPRASALQNSGGLSFGPGLFQKAKNNNKLQRVMQILGDNFLELNEEFTLGIQLPTPNQAVNKIKAPGFSSPEHESPIITVADEDENYYSNIKKPNVMEKPKNIDFFNNKRLKEEDDAKERGLGLKKAKNLIDNQEKEGNNLNLNKIRPKAGFSRPQMGNFDDDDQVIDILNTRKIEDHGELRLGLDVRKMDDRRDFRDRSDPPRKSEDRRDFRDNYDQLDKNDRLYNNQRRDLRNEDFDNNLNEEEMRGRLEKDELPPKGKELTLSRSKGFKEKKIEKPLKIIKKNFIEIPELLDPYSLKHQLELQKIRPFNEKMAFAEFDIGPPKEKLETEEDNLRILGPEPIDFKSTTKSFFIGDKKGEKQTPNQTKKTQFLDQNKKKDEKMSQIDKWMESTMANNEAERAKKANLSKKADEGPEELNLSQILLQAKQKKDTLREKSPEKPGANRLEDTLNQSYYKPDAVEIGKYSVKSDLFREYELYLPVDYYTKLTKKDDQEQEWYVRPHHIETVTEHPLSYKDNILDTKYQSWIEPLEKQLNPIEWKEKDKKEKKEELISDLEKRLRKFSLLMILFFLFIIIFVKRLKEEVDLKKAADLFPNNKNPAFMDSQGLKTMETYYDSVRDHKNRQLMTSSYETMLHELRKEEKGILNQKRGEFSIDLGAPEEKWWEKKGKEFTRELKKYDLLNYKPPSGHSDFVNKLQIKELY